MKYAFASLVSIGSSKTWRTTLIDRQWNKRDTVTMPKLKQRKIRLGHELPTNSGQSGLSRFHCAQDKAISVVCNTRSTLIDFDCTTPLFFI